MNLEMNAADNNGNAGQGAAGYNAGGAPGQDAG